MAYNRKNKLQLIIDIQRIVKEHCGIGREEGRTQEWAYKNIIYPKYRISRRTFYNYIHTPAGVQLERIQREEKLQLSMF